MNCRYVGGPKRSSPDCAGWDDAIGAIASYASASSFFTSVSSTSTIGSSASTAFDVVQRALKHLGLWKFAGGGDVCSEGGAWIV